MSPLAVKATDSKGRITLGSDFAGKQFYVTRLEGNVIQLIPAETVPSREAWLYRNGEAIASVLRGLDQVAAGDFAKEPDLSHDQWDDEDEA